MATFFLTTNTSTADAPAGAQVVIFPGRPGIAGFQTFTPEDGDVYIIDPLLQGNFTFNGDAAFEVNFDQAAQYSVAAGDPAPDFDSTYTFADTTDATVNVAPGADIGLAELIGEGDSLTVNVFGNATTGAISGDGLNAGGGGLIVNQIPVVDGEEFGEEMGPGYNDNNAPTDNGGDVIDGADGDEDVIFGNGGNDTIAAGAGNDTVDGGAGDDIIFGDFGDFGDGASSGGTGVIGTQLDSEERVDGDLYGRFSGTVRDGDFDFSSDAFFLGDDIGVLDGGNRNELRGQTFSQDGVGTDRVAELVDIDFTGAQKSFVGLATVQRSSLHRATDAFSASNGDGFQDVVIINDVDVTFTMNDGTVFQHIRMQFLRGEDGKTYLLADDHPQQGTFNSIRTTVFRNDSGIESFEIESSSGNINGINPIVGNWAAGQFFETVIGEGGDDTITGGDGDDLIYGDNGDSASAGGAGVTGSLGDGPGSTGGSSDRVVNQAEFNTFDFTTDAFFLGNDIVPLDDEDPSDPANPDNDALDGQTFSLTGTDRDGNPTDRTFELDELAFENGSQSFVGVIDIDRSGLYGSNSSFTSSFASGPQNLVIVNNAIVTFTMNDGQEFINIQMKTVRDDEGNTFMVPGDGASPVAFNSFRNLLATNDSGIASFKIQHISSGQNAIIVMGGDWADGQFFSIATDGDGGDDVISGGLGTDTMFGEGGDDTFLVGSAAEGANDEIVGGNGPDQNTDNDVLDLRGAGAVTIDDVIDETDAGARTGTVTFNDGSTLTFSQIEEIITDPANDAPVAVDDAETTPEDTPITFNPAANDSDPDGDTLVVIAVDDPANGTAVVNPDGTVTYTPDADYNGPDTITYTVSDGNGGTDTATVSVTVDPVNDAPVAVDDAETTPEDTPITFNPAANDSDPDGDTLVVIAVDDPANGTAVVNPDGTVTYTPDADYNGPDTITYTVSDGNGGTDTATVSVTVDPANDAPVAVDDAETTPEDTPITFNPAANDSDPDGDTLVVIAVDDPANGTAVVNPDGTVTYTPDADYNGPDTITYTVSDGNGGTDTATVSVTVDPANDAPVAVDDAETTPEDTPITFNPAANDSDPDGDTLVVIAVDDPANGTAVVNPDGTVTYTPDADYNGPDTITYTVSDGNGGTDTATVSVTVDPVNDAPVAVDDAETTPEDTPITFNPAANDSDPDGDTLVVIAVDDPANGTAVVNPDGTVTYTPDADYNGPDTITYTVSDGNGGTDTATVSVTVDPANDAPVAVDDAETTPEDTPITFNPAANDSDPDGDTLVVIAVDDPANGTAVVNPDGTVTYTPDADYNGPDTITYTVSDGNGGTDTATVSVTVDPVNLPPIIDDEFGEVCYDETVTIDLIDVNDIDPEGAPLNLIAVDGIDVTGLNVGESFTLADTGVIITLGLDGDIIVDGEGATISGEATADLLAGESAVDTFTYTLSDGTGGTATANVEVTFKGATDSIDKVIDSLSGVLGSEVCFQIQDNQDPLQGSPTATEAYSLLISDILGLDDDRFEGVTFTEAYCMSFRDDVLATDALSPIESAPLLKGNIFLADESSIPAGALTNEGFAPDFSKIPATENLDLINWILNQDFTSIDNGDGTGETYTDSEVQAAIWGLTDSSITVQSPDGGNSANAFEIIQFAWNDADRDGIDDGGAEGFIVGQDTGIFSENNNIIGLFIDPTDETEALGHSQPFLIGVNLFEDCIC